MRIKDALKEAVAVLNTVDVKGKDNMKRLVYAMERIDAVVAALDEAEKGEHADG